MDRRFVGDFFLEREERFGLEIAEREIFELIADQTHSEAMGDGRVNIERFAGDALLLRGLEIFERAHVVEAVGELDQHDANVVDHCQHHLADGFGLARFGRHHFEAADFCDAFDEMSDFVAEAFGDARDGKLGVFDDVVEEGGGQRRGVEAEVGEDMGDLEQVHEVRLAGFTELFTVALGGNVVGTADHPGVFGGSILAKLGEEFLKAGIELALGAIAVEAEGNVARRRHGLVYACD